jgi:hypothetical protein
VSNISAFALGPSFFLCPTYEGMLRKKWLKVFVCEPEISTFLHFLLVPRPLEFSSTAYQG